MAEKETKTEELLKQVLAELKAINERNKKVDEEERKKRLFEISDAEFSFLLLGVVIGFLAQVFYDYYGSFFPNNPLWKVAVGVVIAFFLMALIFLYMRNQNKKYGIKNRAKS
jgi:F0F1-type ATP synthase assembly protein I